MRGLAVAMVPVTDSGTSCGVLGHPFAPVPGSASGGAWRCPAGPSAELNHIVGCPSVGSPADTEPQPPDRVRQVTLLPDSGERCRGNDHIQVGGSVLVRWRRRLERGGHATGVNDPMFTNAAGEALNPESLTQLFNRKSPVADCRGSDFTTYATPTPRSSSRSACPSRGSPNDLATPTPASGWPRHDDRPVRR